MLFFLILKIIICQTSSDVNFVDEFDHDYKFHLPQMKRERPAADDEAAGKQQQPSSQPLFTVDDETMPAVWHTSVKVIQKIQKIFL
jgi:hypothetical protein